MICSEGAEVKPSRQELIAFVKTAGSIDCHLQKETVRETGHEGYDSSKLKKIAGCSESSTSAEKFDTEESFAITKSSV